MSGNTHRHGERGKAPVALLVAVLAAALAVVGYVVWTNLSSPARQMGWEADKDAAPKGGTLAGVPAAGLEHTGFARWLPEDSCDFFAIYRAGEVVRAIRDSNAWKNLVSQPAVKELQEGFGAMLGGPGAPGRGRRRPPFPPPPGGPGPEVPAAAGTQPPSLVDLFSEAFDTEIVFAGDASLARDLGGAMETGLRVLSVTMSGGPRRGQPGAPPAGKDAAARAAGLADAMEKVRTPSFVLAARVRSEEKFNRFFDEAFRSLRSSRAGGPGGPGGAPGNDPARPEVYSEVKVGSRTFRRLRAKVGELMPPRQLDEAFAETGPMAGVPAADRARMMRALSEMTAVAHLGFLGEYLVLTVGPDDRLLRAIVDRQEGRVPSSLAAAGRFRMLRERMGPDTLLATTVDMARWRSEVRDRMISLLDDLLANSSGAGEEEVALIFRTLRRSLGMESLAPYDTIQGICWRDRGIRGEAVGTFAAGTTPPEARATTMPALVPVDAYAYLTVPSPGLPSFTNGIEIPLMVPLSMNRRMAESFRESDPDTAKEYEARAAAADRALAIFRDRLPATLTGETLLLFGKEVLCSFDRPGDRTTEIVVPTAAAVARVKDPAGALALCRDLVPAMAEAFGGEASEGTALRRRDIDGVEAWEIPVGVSIKTGFHPHFAVVGDLFLFSSSRELTGSILATRKGAAPSLTTTERHRLLSDVLDPKACECGFFDVEGSVRALRRTADSILRMTEGELPEDADPSMVESQKRTRDLIGAVADFFGTMRTGASSRVREGGRDVFRSVLVVEDLRPR